MNKIVLRVSLILLMVFVFCVSLVHASSDINFDLPGVDNSTPNTETSDNNENSNSNNNQIDNGTVVDDNTNNAVVDDNTDTDIDVSSPSETEVLQSAGVSSAPETGLSTTNIINILLIAVGVILILLAIAILIRLNG